MIKWIILGLLGLLVAFAGSLSYRLGAFKDVAVHVADQPEIVLLGMDHIGPYHKIVESLNTVEAWAKEHSLTCDRTFGQFLDDPDVVEEARLRAFVGCVSNSKDAGLVNLAGSELLRDATLKGLHTKVLYAGHYVVAEFSGSPSIGPFKVYPRVKNLITESRLKPQSWSVEIYHILGPDAMSTTYLFPLQ